MAPIVHSTCFLEIEGGPLRSSFDLSASPCTIFQSFINRIVNMADQHDHDDVLDLGYIDDEDVCDPGSDEDMDVIEEENDEVETPVVQSRLDHSQPVFVPQSTSTVAFRGSATIAPSSVPSFYPAEGTDWGRATPASSSSAPYSNHQAPSSTNPYPLNSSGPYPPYAAQYGAFSVPYGHLPQANPAYPPPHNAFNASSYQAGYPYFPHTSPRPPSSYPHIPYMPYVTMMPAPSPGLTPMFGPSTFGVPAYPSMSTWPQGGHSNPIIRPAGGLDQPPQKRRKAHRGGQRAMRDTAADEREGGERKRNPLPKLDGDDEWRMVDVYRRRELLGWTSEDDLDPTTGGRKSEVRVMGISQFDVNVSNLEWGAFESNLQLRKVLYKCFRPCGEIVSRSYHNAWVMAADNLSGISTSDRSPKAQAE
jgi:hypothetical protein